MSTLIQRIAALKLLPVIVLNKVEDAIPLADAFIAGGLPAMEITFRTAAAAECIAEIAAKRPEILLLAGTILTVEQADKALAAGATLLVAPCLNEKVIAHTIANGGEFIPGVCTPTEVDQARNIGAMNIKFFPAEAAGGIAMLKSLRAVYPDVSIMPTGGINKTNLADYLAVDGVLCGGGSWLAPQALGEVGDWDDFTRRTQEAMKLISHCSPPVA